MDVRCPNCQTEYELDDGRLRPGGVTVKCANCAHVFRVRKKGETQVGVQAPRRASTMGLSSGFDEEEEERSWLVRLPDGEIKVCRELATLQRWIVSGQVSEECEISRTGKKWKALRELAELATFFAIAKEAREVAAGERPPPQQEGLADGSVVGMAPVSNSHPNVLRRPESISSMSLGSAYNGAPSAHSEETRQIEDPHLRAVLAGESETVEMSRDEADAAIAAARERFDAPTPEVPDFVERAKSFSESVPDPIERPQLSGPHIMPRQPTVPPPAPGSRARTESGMFDPSGSAPRTEPMSTVPAPKERQPTVPPPIPREAKLSAPPPPPPGKAAPGKAAPGKAAPVADELDADPGDSWRQARPSQIESSGLSGPTGGIAQAVELEDVAFRSSRPSFAGVEDNSKEFKNGRFVASDAAAGLVADDELEPVGRTGGGAVKWIVAASLVLMAGAGVVMFVVFSKKENSEPVAELGIDAGPLVSLDAANADEPDRPSGAELMGAIEAGLDRFEPEELANLQNDLGTPAPESAEGLALSRVENALGQSLLDEAVIDSKRASSAKRESRELATSSLTRVDAFLEKNGDNALAFVTKADAERLAGSPTREVERWLRKAESTPGAVDASRHAEYVKGLLRIRDRRYRDAEKVLDALAKSDPSVRVQYRRALLSFSREEYDDAQERTQNILGVALEHQGASRLMNAIAALRQADTGDTGSGSSSDEGDEGSGGDSSDEGSTASSRPSESYESLLTRADKASGNGDCKEAVRLYEKAIDERPAGIEAHTGLGYCHLDLKNYASAHRSFRAALVVSSRYQDALWGIAEGYQKQGLKEQAITAFEKFIEAHPTTPRAKTAQREIERMRAQMAPPDDAEDDDSEETIIEPEEPRPPKPKFGPDAG